MSLELPFYTSMKYLFLTYTATSEIYTLSLHDALPISVFDGAREPEIRHLLEVAGLPHAGKINLFDGMSGDLRLRRSEEHTSELQSLRHLVCRLLLEKKKNHNVRRDQYIDAEHAHKDIH